MKKLILITIMLLSTLVCASIDSDMCRDARFHHVIFSTCPPLVSGTYCTFSGSLKYADGTDRKVGDKYYPPKWENDPWNKSHDISCEITNIDSSRSDGVYMFNLECTVKGRIRFFRKNGTLKWSRDEVDSTDIYYTDIYNFYDKYNDIYNCYDKSGMSVVKRVNDPSYCR